MSGFYVLLAMIFCHIVDDYYLQGWLASAKQREWWRENALDELYKRDYIWALIMHSFSWSFVVMLPIAYVCQFKLSAWFIVSIVANTIVHVFVDDMKVNRKLINLWTDQLFHMSQIVMTFIMFVIGMYNK